MAGEHGLDRVARPERHDRAGRGLAAIVLALPGLAGALAEGFGNVADNVGEDFFQAKAWFGVHEEGALVGKSVTGS
jgi:hypothetical protein